ncbi:hypothetical protein [Parachlamydia sp. AcF125]|uniref:hypothetical protein n=1 Tax=Parachlamydia sp. AcF125 TaxID=2795736 RepID=UPI001BC9F8C9|nr:hypothetical protein [Parachlamydia sp. AcF125]MBS4168785.1 hypothetical protein [Parachlamydia sp. AcF125]
MKLLRALSPLILAFSCIISRLHAEWSLPVDIAGWSTPVDLSVPGQNASIPKVATDPLGNSVAVWGRFNGANLIIQASSLAFGGIWSEPSSLSIMGRSATSPQVAVDPLGNAVAIWSRSDGLNLIIQSSTQNFGGNWSIPANLSLPGQNATNPQVVVDQSGNAVAIWERSNGMHLVIQAATLPRNGSWTTPVDISLPGQEALQPHLTVNLSGNVLAVWKRFDGRHYLIESAALPYGGSWSFPTILSQPGQNADKPQVALDAAGEAIAVWSRYNGKRNVVQASRSTFGNPWDTPKDLSSETINALNPRINMAQGGKATGIALWEDTTNHEIQSMKMSEGIWEEAIVISNSSEFSTIPQVAMDFHGNAIAVWQNPIKKVVQAATLPFNGKWSLPEDLSESGQYAIVPQVALDSKGHGIAVWIRSNGTHNIVQASSGFNLFNRPLNEKPWEIATEEEEIEEEEIISSEEQIPPAEIPAPQPSQEEEAPIDTLPNTEPSPAKQPPRRPVVATPQLAPPTNFKVKIVKQSFFSQKVRVHKLSWSPSPDTETSGYLLIRNGKTIASIPAKGPFSFSDVRTQKRGKDVYQLYAFTKTGLTSATLTLVVP